MRAVYIIHMYVLLVLHLCFNVQHCAFLVRTNIHRAAIGFPSVLFRGMAETYSACSMPCDVLVGILSCALLLHLQLDQC